MYYLQSRYYNPQVGRFINSDGYVSTGQGVLGYNMFAYCGNNPANRIDLTGMCWYDANGNWCHDNWEYIPGYNGEIYAKTPDPKIVTQLKKNPSSLKLITNKNGKFDTVATYAKESDVSVIARMLYGEDYNSMEGHLWVLENRRVAGGYGGNDFRTLVLAQNQFSCMTGQRSLDPASKFGGAGEAIAWDACVDMACQYIVGGMNAIPMPCDSFSYTWTYSYSKSIENRFPDGVRIGGTWFYHK